MIECIQTFCNLLLSLETKFLQDKNPNVNKNKKNQINREFYLIFLIFIIIYFLLQTSVKHNFILEKSFNRFKKLRFARGSTDREQIVAMWKLLKLRYP